MTTRRVLLGAGWLAIGGCTPSFEDRPWHIEEARLLAIAATPAEARPGEGLALEALMVDPEGPLPGPVQWTACTQPRAAAERTAVSEACMDGESLQPLGNPAVVLSDACARFGPNPPPPMGDEPARRPADPDDSGGYFLPVQAEHSTEDLRGFGFVRVRCDLAGVTRAIFEEYEARYALNVNPQIEALSLRAGDQRVPLGEAPARVGRGESLELELITVAGTSEPYVVLDANSTGLDARREDLRVRWYVTDGTLDRGEERREGEAIGEGSATFTVQWQAPSDATLVQGWAVLVDDRGGVSWSAFAIDVD